MFFRDSSGIITHSLWIYWVTTIPLTLLMLFVVRLLKEARQTDGGSEPELVAASSPSRLDGESNVTMESKYWERKPNKGWTWVLELRRWIFGRQGGRVFIHLQWELVD